MIRFSNQLWRSAVVAVAVAFAVTSVEAGGLGSVVQGAKNLGGSASSTVKQQTKPVQRQASQATRQVQNMGQTATQKAQQVQKSTQGVKNAAGQGVRQTQSQTNRTLGSIREQANSAAKRTTQPAQSAANQAKNVVKHPPITLPTTVPRKTIGQIPQSLPLPKPSMKSVPNVQSAINSTKQTLGRSTQVVKQDLSKNINLRVPRLPAPTVPKLPQRNPLASVPVIQGRTLPNRTFPKVGLPELPGAPLPTLNPKVDAAKAAAAATLVVGTLSQVLNGAPAESPVEEPPQTEILVTENATVPFDFPVNEVPNTPPTTDTTPTTPFEVPVDPATAGLQLAGSIVDLVATGIANQDFSGAEINSTDASTAAAPATGANELTETQPTAPAEEPTAFTFLIHNLTEQPLTYSIRAAGTQWGTYTLAAGKHHKFVVAQEEMELRYATPQGEQIVTVPGEHIYAFASVEGQVQLCNADPEESETAAE